MKSTRSQTAIVAALLLGMGSSIFICAPAFAATAPAPAPLVRAMTAGTTPTNVTMPAAIAPAPTTTPTVAPTTEPAPAPAGASTPVVAPVTTAPIVAPATIAPVATPNATPTPAAPVATPVTPSAPSARVVLDAPLTFPPLAAGHPAPRTPGWTQCWATEINRTDVNNLSPVDMRTWPVYITPIEGQPGYIPHTGAASEGSDIWTQVSRNDPRLVAPPGSGFDRLAPNCYPTANKGSFTTTAEVLDAGNTVISTISATNTIFGVSDGNPEPTTVYTPSTGQQKIPVGTNEAVKTRTTVTVQFPKNSPVIDLSGNPTTDYYVGANQFRFDTPTVNSRTSGFEDPVGVAVECDTRDTVFTFGGSATVTCITTASMPDVTFDAWRTAVLDQYGNGSLVPLTTEFGLESRYVNANSPQLSGGWTPPNGTVIQAGFTYFEVKPATEWLPTAQDKTFRVKAAETLTVTPDGLLTGAQWAQGNVGDLQTHITNIPAGGAVTPNGNLEFTSRQVGDYGFNYFLQDPATGLRSRDATGAIRVYSDAVVVPPPVVTPPVVLTPIAPVAAVTPTALVPVTPVLAFTGSDPMGAILTGILFLLAGLAIGVIRRKRLVREPIIRQGK